MLDGEFAPEEATYLNAFDEVFSELEREGGDGRLLAHALIQQTGSPRDQNRLAASFFEQYVRRWPRYEQWMESQRVAGAEGLQEALDDAQDLDLATAVGAWTVTEINRCYKQHSGRNAPGKCKAEKVSALLNLLDECGADDIVLEQEQRKAIQAAQDEHEVRPDHTEMAELFVHRVIMMTYSRRRAEQQKRVADVFPWRMFDAINDSRTPEDCAALDGTVRRHDDPFWEAHPIPCERLFCRCRVIALSDRKARQYDPRIIVAPEEEPRQAQEYDPPIVAAPAEKPRQGLGAILRRLFRR